MPIWRVRRDRKPDLRKSHLAAVRLRDIPPRVRRTVLRRTRTVE